MGIERGRTGQYYSEVPRDEYYAAMAVHALGLVGSFSERSLMWLTRGLDSAKRFTGKHPAGSKVGLATVLTVFVSTTFGGPIMESLGNLLGAPHRAWDDIYISTWASSVRAKLAGERPLDYGETIYPSVKIVPTVDNVATVRVRPFAGTYLPSGSRTKILGQIPVGKEILNAIMVGGSQPDSTLPGRWAAFNCSDAQGVIWNDKFRQEIAGGKICAVYGHYVETPGLPKTSDGAIIFDKDKGVIGPTPADAANANKSK